MNPESSTATHTCPQCHSDDIAAYDSCHTWGGDETGKGWMSCSGCFSALRIFCCEDDCHWSYTWGLNPSNPRTERNEKDRPNWLNGNFTGGVPEGWEWPANSSDARPRDRFTEAELRD